MLALVLLRPVAQPLHEIVSSGASRRHEADVVGLGLRGVWRFRWLKGLMV